MLISFKGPCGMLWPPKRQPVFGSQDKVMEAAKNACRYISMGKIRREDMAGGCSTATCPLSPSTYLPRRLWRVSPSIQSCEPGWTLLVIAVIAFKFSIERYVMTWHCCALLASFDLAQVQHQIHCFNRCQHPVDCRWGVKMKSATCSEKIS